MRRPLACLAALLACALGAPAAAAEEEARPVDHRDLGGHHFLVSHLVEDPFSVTAFGLNVALGLGEALGPRLDLSTSPPTMVGSDKWYGYATLGQQFDLTVRILEYLSLHGGIVAGVRQGAGQGSAFVVGTNVQVTGLLGAKGSLALGDALRLSLSGEGAFGPQMNILLLKGLQEAKANGDSFAGVNLFNDRNAVTWNVTGGAAWAPMAWLGLLANLRYINTRRVSIEGTEQNGLAGSLSAEFDALPLVAWLPLGTNLAYRRTGSLGSGGLALQDEFGLGLFYTGRRNMALGLELVHRRGHLETQLKNDDTLAWVNFRYYW
jgi:opacity protein-like surface antigen